MEMKINAQQVVPNHRIHTSLTNIVTNVGVYYELEKRWSQL